ncbi:MAG: hypothetical protein RL757_1792 [Bacteroidota bacterium]|jgi:hypothetical protein
MLNASTFFIDVIHVQFLDKFSLKIKSKYIKHFYTLFFLSKRVIILGGVHFGRKYECVTKIFAQKRVTL